MIKDKNFKFKTNVSVDYYTSKKEAIACLTQKGAAALGKNRMAFKEHTLTTDEFLYKAINGYTFCGLFEYDVNQQYWIKSGKYWSKTYPVYRRGANKDAMKIQFKSDAFYKGSQLIFVDIDFTAFTDILDYISCLKFTPTATYCSYSDNVNKNGLVSRRFRMIYVFNEVLDKNLFKAVADALYKQIVSDTDEEMDDDCGTRFSQYMNGVYGNNETYATYNIYSLNDFLDLMEFDEEYEEEEVDEYVLEEDEEEEGEEEDTHSDYKKNNDFKIDEQLVHEMSTLTPEVFMHYNSTKYSYFWKTPAKEYELDDTFARTDDNYLSLYWNREKVLDGMKRRKKLFDRCCLRRIMKPEMTTEEALFNLYVDRNKFFDTSDGVITIEVLVSKVENAFAYTIDELKEKYSDTLEYYSQNRPKFTLNEAIKDKRKMIGKVRTYLTDEKIGELYDTSCDVKTNLETFKSLGIKVSKTRLYDFLKRNGMDTKVEKSVEEYDVNLSIRENMKKLNITYYQAQKLAKQFNNK